jgi:type II pantothenate kinase
MVILGYDCGFSRTKTVVLNENGDILDKSVTMGLPVHGKRVGIAAATGIYADKTGAAIIVPEFEAAAAGLRRLSGETHFTAAVIGTGTPFLRVTPDSVTHIGGTGVGGGTVTGLCKLLTGIDDFDVLLSLNKDGNAANVDLMLRDAVPVGTATDLLPDNVTAANFGNIKPSANNADKISAVFTLVFQTVFVMAALAAKENEKIVVGGSLSLLPEAKKTAEAVGAMHGKTFLFPEDREYAGALGAALCAEKYSVKNT